MPHQQNNDCQRKPPERYFLGVLLVVDEYLGGGYEKRESGCSPLVLYSAYFDDFRLLSKQIDGTECCVLNL